MFQIVGGLCRDCRDAEEAEISAKAIAAQDQRDDGTRAEREAAASVLVTTTPFLPDGSTYDVVDIISAEAAMAMNVFKDIATAWRDTFGGRAKSLQGTLREARVLCLDELRREALKLGADAVIGVDLDYSEFNSANTAGSMVFVVATGTAVRRR